MSGGELPIRPGRTRSIPRSRSARGVAGIHRTASRRFTSTKTPVTARMNLRAFIAKWPYEPEDLRDDTGPILVGCNLPRRQIVCDVHSPAGLLAAGLPNAYPLEADGSPVPHARCQPVGTKAREAGLRGVRARSARSPDGAGRELAWFPATARSVARRVRTLAFVAWYWG